ncbi:MAG: sulfurtransferase TusA family protein [Candidatus Latescibacteria bacterium]|jgi:tRNA 2-thiouridine synthesizing protein A|nr:sulfurtransferase TusA family protein [Candidatus Latescibacterota bacterium]
MIFEQTIDTYGLMCPVPIIRTAEKIKDMAAGEVLEILADDEQILEDLPAWCKSNGHALLDSVIQNNEYKLYVRKGR